MSIPANQSGIIASKEGETIILLPEGPIRREVTGISGQTYLTVLVDNQELGRPTEQVIPPSGIIFVQP